MIWLVEWENNPAVRAARTSFPNWTFKRHTWTQQHNSKSFILYTYFNGAPTTSFMVCLVDDIEYEQKKNINRKITTFAQMFIFKWRLRCRSRRCCLRLFRSMVFSFQEQRIHSLLTCIKEPWDEITGTVFNLPISSQSTARKCAKMKDARVGCPEVILSVNNVHFSRLHRRRRPCVN